MIHNLRTKILLLWFVIALASCTQKANLPNGILTEDEMIDVITDIQLLEAAQSEVNMPLETQSAMRDTNYLMVFNKYSTTAVQFDSSMRVYTKHPNLMGAILENVSTRISDYN